MSDSRTHAFLAHARIHSIGYCVYIITEIGQLKRNII